MNTRHLFDDTSAFRIRRSLVTTNGIGSDVDVVVKRQLDELNELLGKRLLPAAAGPRPSPGVAETNGKSKGRRGAARKAARFVGVGDAALRAFFDLPLTAKHVPAVSGHSSWDDGSLGDFLKVHTNTRSVTLSDHIDATPKLAQLKYAFLECIQTGWSTLPFNSRAVLENHPNITDYLVAHAYYKLAIRDEDALKNVIVNNISGTRLVAEYAAIGAARWLIDQEQLKVESYNTNGGEFVKRLKAPPVSLSGLSFEKAVRDRIRQFMFDRDEEAIIRSAQIFPSLPPDLLPQLVKYIQHSALQVTKANIDIYLPGIVLQVMKQSSLPVAGDTGEPSEEDFRVQFEDDSDDSLEINKAAVLCGAQLYHSMVMGDELDVFGAVHYLAHRRMNTFGGMRIEDPQLRDDLQRYVFDNRYLDLGDRKRVPAPTPVERFRTRPTERQMFHRQVFDEGNAEMPEDMLVNGEFKRLWKVLMLESARYLDRAQASLNPESFVSRQNVMQAVEDIQYNLSTHCTGMATVISPSADAELNFVLERILKHKEILRQVVPEGGTWKRAMDKLNGERRRPAAPAMTLHNKATLGQGILEMIANYTPAGFEDDAIFSAFISKVDAFITTQSILQRPKFAEQEPDEQVDESAHDELPGSVPLPPVKPVNGAAAADEWDF